MILIHARLAQAVAFTFLAVTGAQAAFTYPNCLDVTAAEIKTVPIATRATDGVSEPMKMAFDLVAGPTEDAKGKVDVYFTERMGKVRKFDSKTSKVMDLATIPLDVNQGGSSDGLLGIALDPAFKTSHRVFLYYSFISTGEKNWRVSRFTLNAAHDKMDLASEVNILKVTIHGGSKHPGGAMQFDRSGDLWISTGNDYYDGDFPIWSSANTNDLRGKILRIHPLDAVGPDGKMYSIPSGNLFKPGTNLTKPEIYIMGNRNPYTITLDPIRKWVLWGDVGPDGTNMNGEKMNNGGLEKTEEYDLAQAPGNYGYPFFAGDFTTKPGMSAANPMIPDTTDWHGYTPGLLALPPAIAPLYPYKKSCAITGPLYRYDGDLNSSIKFPPHFQRKWFVSDFNGNNQPIKAINVDDAGKVVSGEENIPGIALKGPLDIQQGPDGAIYVNNYGGVWRAAEANTGIIRIEYTGACRPTTPKLEVITDIASSGQKVYRGPRVDLTHGFTVSIRTEGEFDLTLSDLSGRNIGQRHGRGANLIALNEVKRPGVYFLRVKTLEGSETLKLVKE
jgi:cytochrome c